VGGNRKSENRKKGGKEGQDVETERGGESSGSLRKAETEADENYRQYRKHDAGFGKENRDRRAGAKKRKVEARVLYMEGRVNKVACKGRM